MLSDTQGARDEKGLVLLRHLRRMGWIGRGGTCAVSQKQIHQAKVLMGSLDMLRWGLNLSWTLLTLNCLFWVSDHPVQLLSWCNLSLGPLLYWFTSLKQDGGDIEVKCSAHPSNIGSGCQLPSWHVMNSWFNVMRGCLSSPRRLGGCLFWLW